MPRKKRKSVLLPRKYKWKKAERTEVNGPDETFHSSSWAGSTDDSNVEMCLLDTATYRIDQNENRKIDNYSQTVQVIEEHPYYRVHEQSDSEENILDIAFIEDCENDNIEIEEASHVIIQGTEEEISTTHFETFTGELKKQQHADFLY